MPRKQVQRVFWVGQRQVTITAFEEVGPEDCYTMLLNAVLHRYATGEDVVPVIGRDVKDTMIKRYVEPIS